MSKEPKFIEALKEGKDLHSYSASILYDIPYEEFLVFKDGKQQFDESGEALIDPVMKNKYRNPCKTITFGLLYGAGPAKIANQLKIDITEAKKLMDTYFTKFPKIKELMDSFAYEVRAKRIARSPLDTRYVDFAHIDWEDKGAVSRVINQSKNLPFQGCGASVTKKALIILHKKFVSENIKAKIVNVVHDEILVECKKDISKEVAKIVEGCMIEAFNFYCKDIPMHVSASIGDHWIH